MKLSSTTIVALDMALKGLNNLAENGILCPETRKSLLSILQQLLAIRDSLATVAQRQERGNSIFLKEDLEIAAIIATLLRITAI